MASSDGTGGAMDGPGPGGRAADDPRDAFDRRRRRVLWKMPSGLYLIGSHHNEQRNMMTLNWATQVSTEPKLLAISVEQRALTHGLIDASGVYSLCIIDRADRAVVRKFTKPVTVSGLEDSSSEINPAGYLMAGFACGDGITGAPVFVGALAHLECEVRQRVGVGSHTVFIGEVVAAGFKDDEAESGDVLRMEDTRMNYGG